MAQATEKQVNFLTKLIIRKDFDAAARQRLEIKLSDGTLTVAEASRAIDWLMQQPDKPGTTPDQYVPSARLVELERTVPAGNYALKLDEPDAAGNEWHFYSVDKPGADSKWHGRTFVSLIAGPEKFGVKNPAEREHVLSRIAKDPAEALLKYGQLIGRCGHCGRQLTNDESRRLGIGPVCRAKDGAQWGL